MEDDIRRRRPCCVIAGEEEDEKGGGVVVDVGEDGIDSVLDISSALIVMDALEEISRRGFK